MAAYGGFDAFFEEVFPRVLRVLTAATGDRTVAEEAAQEAFARALARWGRVSAMERPDAYVYVTALNVVRRRASRPEPPAVPPPPPADASEAVAVRVAVRDLVATLPARQREVVLLRYLADLSTDEVARALRIAPGTVKSTLSQALRALRIELEDDDADR